MPCDISCLSSYFLFIFFYFLLFIFFLFFFFFFNDTATTEIYTLSLHDALPISLAGLTDDQAAKVQHLSKRVYRALDRSEEHTSELQSQSNLVCRLLLEKKKKKKKKTKYKKNQIS